MPDPDRLPTGDTLTTNKVRYRFYIPNEEWLVEAFFGEVLDAVNSLVWVQEGAVTVEDASYAMLQTWLSIMPDFIQVGMIVPFAGSVSPHVDLIPCDGRSLNTADYPELFAVIGFTYSSQTGSTFNVPDLRGRAMMGVGTGSGLSTRSLGQSLGEEDHVLSVNELAAHSHTSTPHSHSEVTATPVIINGGIEAPAASALPGVGATGFTAVSIGSTGISAGHNNVQPSLVCNYLIVAR